MLRAKKAVITIVSAMVLSCTMISTVMADETDMDRISGPALVSGTYTVRIDADTLDINASENRADIISKAYKGNVFQILKDCGNGFVQISFNGKEAYIYIDNNATIVDTSSVEEALMSTTESQLNNKRQEIVNFALSLVGGRYRFGGSNPYTGIDCSGFTKYVLENAGGISMLRSSIMQATQGVAINESQMRKGDLLFYGNGSSINHVAMYIGDGKVVHASNPATGITVSPWNYRKPVKIVNMLGA